MYPVIENIVVFLVIAGCVLYLGRWLWRRARRLVEASRPGGSVCPGKDCGCTMSKPAQGPQPAEFVGKMERD